ncbi:hypothetical protein IQ231_12615 [Cuspidothrix issatschenkoi LEGE 03284]|uniref:hypothetical protein n=1 Tax=Cuspidothrix issatschenkoi TaxID=230752 RepID=UPI00188170FF|nr:hypothetical protein [Cuspidothrix issatschenkoi]MBE9232499.1 hypothetical protein [Cuspidothrix issatschenkoi LEGE 03284]
MTSYFVAPIAFYDCIKIIKSVNVVLTQIKLVRSLVGWIDKVKIRSDCVRTT